MNFKKVAVEAGVKNNVAVEPFNWEQFEQSNEGKEAAKKNKLENLKDEIKYYNTIISNRKKELKQAERALRAAKRQLKAAQEEERANKIKALLEANKGKRVIVEWSFFGDNEDKTSSALAEDIEVTVSCRNNPVIGCPKDHWAGLLEIVTRIYVEAEI